MTLETVALAISEHQRAADRFIDDYRKDFHHFIKTDDNTTSNTEITLKPSIQSICEAIKPPIKLLEQEYHDEDENQETLPQEIQEFQAVYHPVVALSFRIFSDIISNYTNLLNEKTTFSIARTIATFTDSSELWSSTALSTQACQLLTDHKSLLITLEFLLDHLLRSTIKPLFGSIPSTVTDAGRKAVHVIKPRSVPIDVKPWRDTHPETLTLLRFAIQNLDESWIEDCWPMIVPPILTTLDTGNVLAKYRGCQILSELLLKVKPTFLKRTGLDQVFWEAVVPCLHFLPPLTPYDISCRVTNQAFDTLIQLALCKKEEKDKNKERENKKDEIVLLNRVMREGVYQGLVYASENVKVVKVLTKNACKVVDAMGIYAVPHLNKLITLYNSSLTAPFATAYPPLLLETAQALICLMTNCWPRIFEHEYMLLRGVCLCWLRIAEDDKEGSEVTDLELVKEGLRNVVRVMKGILTKDKISIKRQEDGKGREEEEEDFDVLAKLLVEKNSKLGTLFIEVDG